MRSARVIRPSIGPTHVSNITAVTTPGLPKGRRSRVDLTARNRLAHHRGPQDVGLVEDVGVHENLSAIMLRAELGTTKSDVRLVTVHISLSLMIARAKVRFKLFSSC